MSGWWYVVEIFWEMWTRFPNDISPHILLSLRWIYHRSNCDPSLGSEDFSWKVRKLSWKDLTAVIVISMEPTIESTHMAISVVVESFKGFLFQNLYLSWKHWMIKSRNVHQKKKSNLIQMCLPDCQSSWGLNIANNSSHSFLGMYSYCRRKSRSITS